MNTSVLKIKKLESGIDYNFMIYLCVFLACFVPRYISALKIHVGINISFFTIFVFAFWILSVRGIAIINKIEYYFFGIWAVFIIASLWRSEMIGVWAYYFDWILTAILFQQILCANRDENTYKWVVYALTDALAGQLLIGLYEITAHTYLFEIGSISSKLYGTVAISMFHNLNDYVTFVATLLPFAIYRMVTGRNIIEKIYSLALIALSCYFIVISESRAALLTLILLIFAVLFVLTKRTRYFPLLVGGAILAACLILYADLFGIRTTIHDMLFESASVSARSDTARINLLKNGLYFLSITYGFGVGAGNLFKWLAEKSIYYIGGLSFIHNWYAEILVTFGVIFFVIYVVFHLKVLYKLASGKYGKNLMKTTMLISFLCFSAVSISSSSNVYSEWVWMYLVLMSVFVSSLEIERSCDYQLVHKKQS